jgi:anti-sigma28 factor (negative regulator of flagellin synthesis)
MKIGDLMRKLQVDLEKARKEDGGSPARPADGSGGSSGDARPLEKDSIQLETQDIRKLVESLSRDREVREEKIAEAKRKIVEGYYRQREIPRRVSENLLDEEADIVPPDLEE